MNEQLYKRINDYMGWGLFALAALVFMMTIEPTVSFWDAGERLAVSYKLQIGHPPGAPLYQMMARIFSLLAFGDVTRVAYWINAMSAVAGGLTIMFLFWTITMLARKLVVGAGEMTKEKALAIFGAGAIGALTLTFSDSFWYTAVEAEVYVTSLFLTAFVFWVILRWEAASEEKDALKWLVLISYVIGLSIGVHMLNLLAIPAIVFVYYFKKFRATPMGIVATGLVSIVMLWFIMEVLIPGLLNLDWQFERFFVNSIGLPFHSGTIVFFILLVGGIAYGLYYTHKRKKILANTLLLCFTFIVIGYSSFFMLVIRSNAQVPINENAPKDALAMKAYLGREQYGDWPLLHGPYYNAPVIASEDGKPVWGKNRQTGRYEVINERIGLESVYDPEFTTIFPRMWSNRQQIHVSGYENWSSSEGRPVRVTRRDGSTEVINKPTFADNLRFFFSYQAGHMYWRYFMWNFSGRQNDIQGHGSPVEGNWITGIPFLDEMRLGPQADLPESMTSNRGYNRYYLLPFLLGMAGFLYQLKRRPNDALVVGLLFIMAGLAIIVYLNQTPYQPRERDYSYIASFYAFAIWVGLGVLAVVDFLSKKLSPRLAGILAVAVSLLLVPVSMARENWDDHDRSGRYLTRDVAINYLESCAPNAVIFTNGDNDTFPLWYVQEVEGVRTDVKVVNLSLLNTDWYINNMTRRKTYEGEPLPFSVEPIKYRDGTRDFVYIIENENLTGYQNLRSVLEFVFDDAPRTRIRAGRRMEDYIPTKQFRLPVDSARVLATGTVPREEAHLIVPAIEWTIDDFGIYKNHLMVLDFLVQNNWERPVYFATTTGADSYLGLEDYFQLEGMAYRLVPIRSDGADGQTGRINTDILYENLMNKFTYGNINDPKVYLNEDHRRLTTNFRNIFQRLGSALVRENKLDSAIAVLDRSVEIMPERNVPYNYFALFTAEAYYEAGAMDKGDEIVSRMVDIFEENLRYYFSFTGRRAGLVESQKQDALAIMQRMFFVTRQHGQEELSERAEQVFDTYYDLYVGGY